MMNERSGQRIRFCRPSAQRLRNDEYLGITIHKGAARETRPEIRPPTDQTEATGLSQGATGCQIRIRHVADEQLCGIAGPGQASVDIT